MTLILTELSMWGIAMAADSASTVESFDTLGGIKSRSFNGLIKVIPVQQIQSGLSYWGWVKIPPDDPEGVWMDWWIRDFLTRNRNNFQSITELSNARAN
jgi:hypothetical protein